MTAPRGEKVVLVVAPFWGTVFPSLAVSQLKANLVGAGHSTEVLYLDYLFARRIGIAEDEWLSRSTRAVLLGEFVFSAALYGDEPGDVDRYMAEVMAGTDMLRFLELHYREAPADLITRWREEAIRFCDGEGLEAILDTGAPVVGFSTTFQQNCASLALLNRVKRARPDVVTVMGGANCEGEMGEELFARFASIDHLGQGECDQSLVELVDALAEGRSGRGTPGIRSREAPGEFSPGRPITSQDLDDLPFPDLSDYFAQRTAHGIDGRVRPVIAMETARGCWWGAKHHCKFCGVNGEFMGFRSKSPQRVLDEIDWLVDRHGPYRIWMSDNILNLKYFKSVLPRLAESKRTTLFYETKSNLTRDQVRLLAEARVNQIQPGIESLSDKSLRLMDKGATKLQHIQLLRWCAEYGVEVFWNYLLGFPGEDEGELPVIAEEAELLHHLEPPRGAALIRIDRFSPYFDAPEELGIGETYPAKKYEHVHRLPAESLRRIAYDYTSDTLVEKATGPGVATISAMKFRWQKLHPRSFLYAIPRRKSLLVIDTRRCARRRIHRLTGLHRAVYELCDRARSLAHVVRELGPETSPDSVSDVLASLVADKLMLANGGRYLSLAIEPGRKLTVKNELGEPLKGRGRVHSSGPLVQGIPGLLRSPRTALRLWDIRLRHFRRRLHAGGTRLFVLALARLLEEKPGGRASERLPSASEAAERPLEVVGEDTAA